MTISRLHPDVIATKYATLKHWQYSRVKGRHAFLGGWQTARLDDGTVHVSARIRGRDAAEALRAFMNHQELFLAQRIGPNSGHLLPFLDVSQPGRTAACWRLSGVWVEVWHSDDVPAPSPPVQGLPVSSSAGPVPSSPGGRLPHTRKRRTTNPKETTSR
ncbi:hypothetical protein [Streptomyces cylindrosporus]|uniref:Uncharacterized protein n=1 Tax=Streptomyces cylindrosporus TaxID=2927583 RepID=A0ABS9YR09_9ACTN|nr:hypothetical protein [Streptomyces cylindrosporus]MCI3279161.1 hypothetical protein [Streptomyces cylindrosporus]